ncbi:MAG: beta-lactamase family protein, partial [Candidatus Aminicenantes bacterium]|nr:beta-lactamase family protein [Candidatus Aminicenantes bacterium]
MTSKAALAVVSVVLAAASCDPQKALTQKRVRAAERGLMRTVYLKGLSPERLTLVDRLAFYRVPGIGLAVVDKNAVEWSRAYGLKDAQSGQTLTPETVGQAGALSQLVASAVVFKLAQDGRLRLDDEVRRHLKSWSFPPEAGAETAGLTIRQLLTHGAGLSDELLSGYRREDSRPTLVQMLEGVPPAKNGPLWVL